MIISEDSKKPNQIKVGSVFAGQAFKYGGIVFIKMEVGSGFNVSINTEYPKQCFVYDTQADCLAVFDEDHLVDRVYICYLKIK